MGAAPAPGSYPRTPCRAADLFFPADTCCCCLLQVNGARRRPSFPSPRSRYAMRPWVLYYTWLPVTVPPFFALAICAHCICSDVCHIFTASRLHNAGGQASQVRLRRDARRRNQPEISSPYLGALFFPPSSVQQTLCKASRSGQRRADLQRSAGSARPLSPALNAAAMPPCRWSFPHPPSSWASSQLQRQATDIVERLSQFERQARVASPALRVLNANGDRSPRRSHTKEAAAAAGASDAGTTAPSVSVNQLAAMFGRRSSGSQQL